MTKETRLYKVIVNGDEVQEKALPFVDAWHLAQDHYINGEDISLISIKEVDDD